MGSSFFLDDSVLCNPPCGHHFALFLGNIGVLGLLWFDSSVSPAPPILYEENGLKGYAQGVWWESHDGGRKVEILPDHISGNHKIY